MADLLPLFAPSEPISRSSDFVHRSQQNRIRPNRRRSSLSVLGGSSKTEVAKTDAAPDMGAFPVSAASPFPAGEGRRLVAVWLPRLSTDRRLRTLHATARRHGEEWREPPLVSVTETRGRPLVTGLNPLAARAGIKLGMALPDARLLHPALLAYSSDPAEEKALLSNLADWALRYTPWVAVDGGDGLLMDISGCAHLMGGEPALLDDLTGRIAAMGLAVTAVAAGSVGAAWAVSRSLNPGETPYAVIPSGEEGPALQRLPVERLRPAPETTMGLHRLGLHRIGELRKISRTGLASRFGPELLLRLDQAMGLQGEAITPRRPPVDHAERLRFADPIGSTEAVRHALQTGLETLCARLELQGLGIRRLTARAIRTDGSVGEEIVGTSRSQCRPAPLLRLFDRWLDRLHVGFGLDAVIVEAPHVEPLVPDQPDLSDRRSHRAAAEAEVIDRLTARLGPVKQLKPVATHWPERAAKLVTAEQVGLFSEGWTQGRQRPVQLLVPPEPVEVTAPLPDAPPLQFRWRNRLIRIAQADGPERLLPEWWPGEGERALPGPRPVPLPRDYYRVEDEDGGRWWLYRAGFWRTMPEGEVTDRTLIAEPSWFLHGVFA